MTRQKLTHTHIAALLDAHQRFAWAVRVEVAAQRQALKALGLRTDSSEARERIDLVDDFLYGDAPLRFTLAKLGLAPPADEPAKRRRVK